MHDLSRRGVIWLVGGAAANMAALGMGAAAGEVACGIGCGSPFGDGKHD